MQLKQLNFIHFFISDKEYLLELDTIKDVIISKSTIEIRFKSSESIIAVTEFFVKFSEEEFIFFFGNNDTKYNSPVVSRTCTFNSSGTKTGAFYLEFTIKDN